MKLLIVDDSAMVRRAVSSAYEGTVFTDIKTASDGMLAVSIFKEALPDVVTLDITMPHMDGLAALVHMLKIKPNTQVLVISALADHYTAVEALKRGANQFICKPFSKEELKEALDDLVEELEEENNDNEELQSENNELSSSNEAVFSFGTEAGNTDTTQDKEQDKEQDTVNMDLGSEQYPSGFVEVPRESDSISIIEDNIDQS